MSGMEKVSSALSDWKHGERDGMAIEWRWNGDGIDRFPTNFSSEFCQVDIA